MSDKQTAIIIGAGAGGLALANILAKAGLEVHVYEKNTGPGGRMDKLEFDGFTFDTGPSWYLMKDVFERYFNLFGKKTNDYYQLVRLDPAYKVFYETSEPIVITGSLTENLATFAKLESGADKKLEQYIRRGEQNYQAALAFFLYNPFRRPTNMISSSVLRSLPAFLPVFTQNLHGYIARQFSTTELQQILEYPSVFLGASPFNTPALYQLMSYLDFKEGVFYPKQGMYAVTEALCALGSELGVIYHYGAAVTSIVTENKRATGIRVNDSFVPADIVISNADLHFTETQLLTERDRSYPERYWRNRTAGPSALLLYIGVKGSLPELEHHNLFFVADWKENFDQIYTHKAWPENASIYVSKTTATDTSTAPKGHENMFVLVPLPAGVDTDEAMVDDTVQRYLTQLETMSGIADLRKRIVSIEVRKPEYFAEKFNAWQNTALGLSHTLKQSAFLRPSVRSKKLKNLYYVGAGTQPGIGVPICIISAQLVYKYISKDWSPGAPETIKEISL